MLSLIFFALEQGLAFAAESAFWTIPGMCATLVAMLGGSGLLVGYPVNSLPVMVILHSHYDRDVIKSFIKIFPAGIFGVCLFNLVAWLSLERLGLTLTIALGYSVDLAYLAGVAWVRGRNQ